MMTDVCGGDDPAPSSSTSRTSEGGRRPDAGQPIPKGPGGKRQTPPRAWQRMLSGRRLDLLDPSPFDIEIEDIAHGLARVARWNGQTEGEYAFTVAQHSVEVEGLCHDLQPGWDPAWRLAALLHDAPEYVIGDLISPFKTAVGLDYKAFEARLESAIHVRFGLPASLPRDVKALIKRADTVAAYFEATQLAGFSIEEAQSFFGEPRGLTRTLVPLPAKEAHSAFLARFHALIAALDQSRSRAGEDLNGPTPDQARAWAKGTLL